MKERETLIWQICAVVEHWSPLKIARLLIFLEGFEKNET